MLNKLEKKIGRYAIKNLPLVLIITYVIGYVLSMVGSGTALNYLCFYPPAILQGQIWRIITWVIMPPGSLDILTILMLFIFYQFGSLLENAWGAFRFNLYMLLGVVLTAVGGFVAYFINPMFCLTMVNMSTYYISLSIFLCVAAFFPNMQVLLYFIIPVKLKWAAAIHVAYMVFNCIRAAQSYNAGTFVMIIASLLNCAIMIYLVRHDYSSPGQQFKAARRRAQYQKKVRESAASSMHRTADGKITKHKCAICGRTELDGDDLTFRFCSKCEGNYEYCQEHLFTHVHIKK